MHGWTKDKNGYLVSFCRKTKTSPKMHRLILNAKDGEIVDHINNKPNDNRRSNLRISNKSLNGLNRSAVKARSNTGHLNISIVRGLYVARITQRINGKRLTHYFSSKIIDECIEWVKNKKSELISAGIPPYEGKP
jgi:hypothetical protein